MLIQLDINKCSLSQLTKLYKLYINSVSTKILRISKIDFVKYKNQIFPNNSHVYLRACDDASSYYCPFPLTVSKIPKWGCILNCCSDFP